MVPRRPFRLHFLERALLAFSSLIAVVTAAGGARAEPPTIPPAPAAVAQQLDAIFQRLADQRQTPLMPRLGDMQFLRRVRLDLVGQLPTPDELAQFTLDPDHQKQVKEVRRLLHTDAYARYRAAIWTEVLIYPVEDVRMQYIAGGPLTEALTEALAADRGWDQIAAEFLTATGSLDVDGRTGWIAAHQGRPEQLAGEAARLFLGVRLACAECHDHPYDGWTRRQFHQLAAFFPRVDVIRQRRPGVGSGYAVYALDDGQQVDTSDLPDPAQLLGKLDINRDQLLTLDEIPERNREGFRKYLTLGDKNNDQALSLGEFQAAIELETQRRRRPLEHFMPDLLDPLAPGQVMTPTIFTTGGGLPAGATDAARRAYLARQMSATEDLTFARAYVNRTWAELMGRGFVEPVDDIGPHAEVSFHEAFDLLARSFRQSGYSTRWLLETIATTELYQRQAAAPPTLAAALPPLAVIPTQQRGEQIAAALSHALGVNVRPRVNLARALKGGGPQAGSDVVELFRVDPSARADEARGSVPQVLYLMNASVVNESIRAQGGTPLARLRARFSDDREALTELYLAVLARKPTTKEMETCLTYIARTGQSGEALEDIMWALVNSAEFLVNR